MKRALQRGAASALLALVVAACGARTGLLVPEPDECVSLTATAPIADLDVFTMVDSSGSMEFVTASGSTKWQAVRAALAGFLQDPESKGIGVAISFFPVIDLRVPEMCFDPSECGVPDMCETFGVCAPSGSELCDTDADCAAAGLPDETCTPVGFCDNDSTQACFPQQGVGCEDIGGNCLDVGLCRNRFDCNIETYEAQVVDVTPLPDAAPTVLGAIDSRVPEGGTTTLPALSGAIQAAKVWTQENPGHKAIVVLATDGLPTHCDQAIQDDMPQVAIQHLVDVAAEGAKSGIQTFVIGVFNEEEQAEAAPNLNAIAAGGGTEKAFIISTEEDVTQQLLEALNEVRITSKSCEFAIPMVDGALPDLERLKVRITPENGEPVTLERRDSAIACGSVTGGFYYDAELGGPVPPGRVILCPASCDLFGSAQNRVVDLQVDCEK